MSGYLSRHLAHFLSTGLRLLLVHGNRVQNDAQDRKKNTQNALVTNRLLARGPAQPNNKTRLQMPDDSAADRSGIIDDEELREIDKTRAETAENKHHPLPRKHVAPDRESVGEEADEGEDHGTERDLVVQELHAAHLQLLVILRDPHGVDRARGYPRQGEAHTKHRDGFHSGMLGGWERVIVRYYSHTYAGRNESEGGQEWNPGAIEAEVDGGRKRREQDPDDLVAYDRRIAEGEIYEYDVDAHDDGEG
jgi:hypothetical protein